MLTCACGARFEVDEALAGQEVLCPECQQPLPVPAAARPPRLTSGWALASVVLALVGAFTIVGTVAAALAGLYALAHIARNRERVAGAGFAVFGVSLGVLFTALTVFALAGSDPFGLEALVRERTASQQVDTSGPMEVVLGAKGFAITRPTEKWGRVLGDQSDDIAVSGLQRDRDLLLMQAVRHAFVDVRSLARGNLKSLEQCQDEIMAELQTNRRPTGHFGEDDDDFPPATAQLRRSQRLPDQDGAEVRELEVDVRCAGQAWHFLVRLYRRGNGPIYVVRAYAPRRRFSYVQAELTRALDSFRILGR